MSSTTTPRFSPRELAARVESGQISIIDVREPMEYVGGHIPGSQNIPLSRLGSTSLPEGPLVLVCQSGKRSEKGLAALLREGHPHPLADLEGGMGAWQQAGLPMKRRQGAHLPLMRQVQIAAGSLVLLGVILSQTLAPGWIWLAGFVGAGLTFAGVSGFCGMARLLAVMPWNRVQA
ncbi:rhodanese-like domain-containing protein [Synechococcus sp. EJ6-Ellesmere]|uniref:rhodanese-like domain-containing protein n=1 Tax=Synechococcus sp. EJ6-Ellesmere TaxID=2823734 RepID=UPI0020CF33F2|nr:rhodanese-like domain-containing protein [Synechococcus sp. EJ6-Ellesmere]MCP9826053.1 rhodanese-like domain-containing protein [Synechococcus sp. EJ6-Ellesmere]